MPDLYIISSVAFMNYLIMQHKFNQSERAYETDIYGHDEIKIEPVWRLALSVIVLAVMCVMVWAYDKLSK